MLKGEDMIHLADQVMPWWPGMTLADVIRELKADRHVVVVRLDGKLVSRPDFAVTQVPDEAEVELLPMIAGG